MLDRRVAGAGYLVAQGIRSMIMARVGGQERPVGLLVSCNQAPRRFADEDRRVLTSLAHHLAVALDKVRVHAELHNNLRRLQETQAQIMQADKLPRADVLVVEDEEPLRGLVAEVIHALGHHVVDATTGHEALARLREQPYDLVLLDLRLPDVDGRCGSVRWLPIPNSPASFRVEELALICAERTRQTWRFQSPSAPTVLLCHWRPSVP